MRLNIDPRQAQLTRCPSAGEAFASRCFDQLLQLFKFGEAWHQRVTDNKGWRTGNAKTFGNFVIALDNFFDFWIVHVLAQSDRVQSIFGGDAQRLFA